MPEEVRLPPEDGDTFAANALGKAAAAAAATGIPAIADDSGIEAAALGGAPGIRSARYAGEGATDESNLAKLTAEVPAGSALRYVCVIAFVDPVSGDRFTVEGTLDGTMAATRAGGGGFGYDPVFIPDGAADRTTVAELDDASKDAISHRGRAARMIADRLAARSG